MASEQLEITPSVLMWAIERSGYTTDQLAGSFLKIEQWVSGDTAPTYAQLESLAEKLKVPIAVFFFPEPPDVPPIQQSFRTLPADQFADLPPQMRHLLRKGKALQLSLSELNSDSTENRNSIIRDLKFSSDTSVLEMTKAVREYLGISIEQQMAWPNADEAFAEWRSRFINAGVYVFKDAFRIEGYSGFCLYDDREPIIYVNNSNSPTRQIFTLFHELAHLMFRTSGIDWNDSPLISGSAEGRAIEVACNRFASQFLLPDEVVKEHTSTVHVDEQLAAVLAGRFNISREVVYRRFLDLGLIDEQSYRQAAELWSRQAKKTGSGGNYYNNQLVYLGIPYTSKVFHQYYRNKITEAQVADYLNIKPKSVAAFEEQFSRRVDALRF